jgi:hypothetical protein
VCLCMWLQCFGSFQFVWCGGYMLVAPLLTTFLEESSSSFFPLILPSAQVFLSNPPLRLSLANAGALLSLHGSCGAYRGRHRRARSPLSPMVVVALGTMRVAVVLDLAGLERRRRGAGGCLRWAEGCLRWAGVAATGRMGRRQVNMGVGAR